LSVFRITAFFIPLVFCMGYRYWASFNLKHPTSLVFLVGRGYRLSVELI
jgi:hypothetical protein